MTLDAKDLIQLMGGRTMTEDELRDALLDAVNESLAEMKTLSRELIPAAAYGAGLLTARFMLKLRLHADEVKKAESQTDSNGASPAGRQTEP